MSEKCMVYRKTIAGRCTFWIRVKSTDNEGNPVFANMYANLSAEAKEEFGTLCRATENPQVDGAFVHITDSWHTAHADKNGYNKTVNLFINKLEGVQ